MAVIDNEPQPRLGAAGPPAPSPAPSPVPSPVRLPAQGPGQLPAQVPFQALSADTLPTLATIVAVAVFVAAGNWQRGRMEEAKEALRAQLDAASAMPAVALPDVGAWDAWRYRPVRAEGMFDATRQFLVDNRVQAGRVGFHVVTPLVLADGRVVLVNRGWVAAGANGDLLPAVPPPAGRRHRPRRTAHVGVRRVLAADDGAGTVRQNLDPARFAAATGVRVLPIVVEATAPAASPEDAPLVRDWPLPDAGSDKHRIYMTAAAFAALAAGLWLIFRLRRRRTPSPGPDAGTRPPTP